MTFLRMRDDASQKLPSVIRGCPCLCFLIRACRFCPLFCIGGGVSVSSLNLLYFTSSSSPSFLPLPPPLISSSPPPCSSHWSLSPAYLYSSLNLSTRSHSFPPQGAFWNAVVWAERRQSLVYTHILHGLRSHARTYTLWTFIFCIFNAGQDLISALRLNCPVMDCHHIWGNLMYLAYVGTFLLL